MYRQVSATGSPGTTGRGYGTLAEWTKGGARDGGCARVIFARFSESSISLSLSLSLARASTGMRRGLIKNIPAGMIGAVACCRAVICAE